MTLVIVTRRRICATRQRLRTSTQTMAQFVNTTQQNVTKGEREKTMDKKDKRRRTRGHSVTVSVTPVDEEKGDNKSRQREKDID